MAKVVKTEDIFFEDYIKIAEDKILDSLNLPIFPITEHELEIFYNGRIFAPVKNVGENFIKVYTEKYGLEEQESHKKREEKYFTLNSVIIDKSKKDFL